jgi:hypothetical protein
MHIRISFVWHGRCIYQSTESLTETNLWTKWNTRELGADHSVDFDKNKQPKRKVIPLVDCFVPIGKGTKIHHTILSSLSRVYKLSFSWHLSNPITLSLSLSLSLSLFQISYIFVCIDTQFSSSKLYVAQLQYYIYQPNVTVYMICYLEMCLSDSCLQQNIRS